MVILLEKPMIKELLKAFPPPNYYLDEATILDALKRREMFNLLDIKYGKTNSGMDRVWTGLSPRGTKNTRTTIDA